MAELVGQNWILLVVALVLGILAAWWVLTSSRRGRVEIEREDSPAAEGPARRNQALIDAPPASARDAATPPRDMPVAPVVPDAPTLPTEEPQSSVQPAAEPAASPAPATPPPPAAPSAAPAVQPGAGDDLTRIKGLGPKLADQLNSLGITSLAQIAAWDEAAIDRVDANLGRFKGRIRRDSWVEQARFLAAGDVPGYEARFGRL